MSSPSLRSKSPTAPEACGSSSSSSSSVLSRFACRRFEGRHAVVTASTAGIGLAIAERLAEEGAKVSICSRRQASVDSVLASFRSRGLQGWGMACHVGDGAQVADFLSKAVQVHGPIDVLVLNAAVNPFAGPLLETPDSAVDKILDLNVKAAIRTVRLATPHLAPLHMGGFGSRSGNGGGTTYASEVDRPLYGPSIVLISSYTAYNPSYPIAMYAVSKTALLGLTSALAAELSPPKLEEAHGERAGEQKLKEQGEQRQDGRRVGSVRVNCVAPGIIPTRFSKELVSDSEKAAALREGTCLKRLGAPEEIAAAVAFLASDDASYITGETLVVAGGARCRL